MDGGSTVKDGPFAEARILVTGASGFVGSHAVSEFARSLRGAKVFRVDSRRHASGSDTDSIALDITSRSEVQAAIAGIRPTGVLHLAAVATPSDAEANLARAWEVNVLGTMHLASAVLEHAPEARFLFAGSSEAYGETFNRVDGPVSEEDPLLPMNNYATTKAAADLLIGQFAHRGLRAIRFRPFNHTGPGQTENYVVPAFARQVARIEKGLQAAVIEVGAIDGERDFLDVRDVVRAYAAALMDPNDLEPGTALNLASGRPQSIRSVLDRLIALGGIEVEVRVDPARYRPNKVMRTCGNSQRAKSLLGWEPSIPFDDTLTSILDDWRTRVKT